MLFRQLVLKRIASFVGAVCGDPVFRRQLRYRPALALGAHGMDAALAPARLPVRHYEVDVRIDAEHLFGCIDRTDPVSPPRCAELVSWGVKPLALVHGTERDLTALRAWAERQGLVALLSPDEFSGEADEGKGGYMNLARDQRPARAGSGAMRGLVIGPDENQAILGWLSLLFRWDAFLGPLLGYPPCCSAAFVERWPRALAEHQGDVAPLVLEASPSAPHDWRLNVFARYFGPWLVEHFPCSLACPASLTVALRHEATLRTLLPEQASELENVLRAPVLYTERSGVFSFPGAQLEVAGDDHRLHYTPAAMRSTDEATALHAALRQRSDVVVRGQRLLLDLAPTRAWLVDFSGHGAQRRGEGDAAAVQPMVRGAA